MAADAEEFDKHGPFRDILLSQLSDVINDILDEAKEKESDASYIFDENNKYCILLTICIEKCIVFGMKTSSIFTTRSLYEFVRAGCAQAQDPILQNDFNAVHNVLLDKDGKARAWIRYALNNKHLSSEIYQLARERSFIKSWFEPYSIMSTNSINDLHNAIERIETNYVNFNLLIKDSILGDNELFETAPSVYRSIHKLRTHDDDDEEETPGPPPARKPSEPPSEPPAETQNFSFESQKIQHHSERSAPEFASMKTNVITQNESKPITPNLDPSDATPAITANAVNAPNNNAPSPAESGSNTFNNDQNDMQSIATSAQTKEPTEPKQSPSHSANTPNASNVANIANIANDPHSSPSGASAHKGDEMESKQMEATQAAHGTNGTKSVSQTPESKPKFIPKIEDIPQPAQFDPAFPVVSEAAPDKSGESSESGRKNSDSGTRRSKKTQKSQKSSKSSKSSKSRKTRNIDLNSNENTNDNSDSDSNPNPRNGTDSPSTTAAIPTTSNNSKSGKNKNKRKKRHKRNKNKKSKNKDNDIGNPSNAPNATNATNASNSTSNKENDEKNNSGLYRRQSAPMLDPAADASLGTAAAPEVSVRKSLPHIPSREDLVSVSRHHSLSTDANQNGADGLNSQNIKNLDENERTRAVTDPIASDADSHKPVANLRPRAVSASKSRFNETLHKKLEAINISNVGNGASDDPNHSNSSNNARDMEGNKKKAFETHSPVDYYDVRPRRHVGDAEDADGRYQVIRRAQSARGGIGNELDDITSGMKLLSSSNPTNYLEQGEKFLEALDKEEVIDPDEAENLLLNDGNELDGINGDGNVGRGDLNDLNGLNGLNGDNMGTVDSDIDDLDGLDGLDDLDELIGSDDEVLKQYEKERLSIVDTANAQIAQERLQNESNVMGSNGNKSGLKRGDTNATLNSVISDGSDATGSSGMYGYGSVKSGGVSGNQSSLKAVFSSPDDSSLAPAGGDVRDGGDDMKMDANAVKTIFDASGPNNGFSSTMTPTAVRPGRRQQNAQNALGSNLNQSFTYGMDSGKNKNGIEAIADPESQTFIYPPDASQQEKMRNALQDGKSKNKSKGSVSNANGSKMRRSEDSPQPTQLMQGIDVFLTGNDDYFDTMNRDRDQMKEEQDKESKKRFQKEQEVLRGNDVFQRRSGKKGKNKNEMLDYNAEKVIMPSTGVILDDLIDRGVKELFDEQNGRCFSCGDYLGSARNSNQRQCYYTRRLYCTLCLDGSKFYHVPSKIIFGLDCNKYPVATNSYRHLTSMFEIPSIPLSKIVLPSWYVKNSGDNKASDRRNEQMQQLPQQHNEKYMKILSLGEYLEIFSNIKAYYYKNKRCETIDQVIDRTLRRRKYLLEAYSTDKESFGYLLSIMNEINKKSGKGNVRNEEERFEDKNRVYGLVSMRDMVELFNRDLLVKLHQAKLQIWNHIKNCKVCKQSRKGVSVEFLKKLRS